MKLHLFGASASGVTTLGEALGRALGVPYFDTDAYFWEPTEPPFTVRRAPAARDAALAHGLARQPAWVLGGSIVGWDEAWLTAFDLAVFLWLPPALRMQRLHEREHQRYGDALFTNPAAAGRYQNFADWAAGYDAGTAHGSRTLANHTAWLERFACPVLELRGNLTVAERQARVLAELARRGLS